MGQAVKYAILAAALAACLITFVAFLAEIPIDTVAGEFASGTNQMLSSAGDALRSARGLINLITGVPVAVDLAIFICLAKPILLLVLKISVVVTRWLNQ